MLQPLLGRQQYEGPVAYSRKDSGLPCRRSNEDSIAHEFDGSTLLLLGQYSPVKVTTDQWFQLLDAVQSYGHGDSILACTGILNDATRHIYLTPQQPQSPTWSVANVGLLLNAVTGWCFLNSGTIYRPP